MKRYCQSHIYEDLKKKMVFIGGPRQVGKTMLSKTIAEEHFTPFDYLNWDVDEDKKTMLAKQWRGDSRLVIFDELHKYRRWKQWIKGVYDKRPPHQQYLVTGSARLDVYRQGGDSLLGRYHYWRLHPFTIDELPDALTKEEGLRRLLTLGGFPEPFLSNDEREAKRWRQERLNRVLNEDIRDLENIRHIQLLKLFVHMLRDRAGSLVTLSNIAGDLQIAPKTASHWLQLLERMYLVFSVYPLTHNIPRAILKPPKVYFYDNADVEEDAGKRFENLVATTLLKRLHFLEDYFGHECELRYIRDKDGREVDFATIIDGKLHELIEVKTSDDTISSALKYYTEKLKPKHAIQIVASLKRSYDSNGIQVRSPIEYFSNPPWMADYGRSETE